METAEASFNKSASSLRGFAAIIPEYFGCIGRSREEDDYVTTRCDQSLQ
jgi:hypothetical protein